MFSTRECDSQVLKGACQSLWLATVEVLLQMKCKKVKKSLHTSQGDPSGRHLSPVSVVPGWDANSLQGYPPALNSLVPIYIPHCESKAMAAGADPGF